jgi:transposase
MPPDYDFFVGIDWGTQAHQWCVIDAGGRRIAEGRVPHSGVGLRSLIEQLMPLSAEPARIAVVLEVPRGAVVDTLLEHGCAMFAINPKQLDRFRDRHTVAGAKDDRRDAFVLADALRTDHWAFRRLASDDPRLIQLREVSRVHDELGQEHTRLTNRLREQLLRFYPQALTLCPAADEPWLWALLEQAPTPVRGQALRPGTLRALLADHRIRRFPATELQAALHVTALRVAPGTAEAAADHIALLLPRLRLIHEQRRQSARRLEHWLAALAAAPDETERQEHRDVTILRSLPGVGRVVAATMLAEASRPLAARDYQTLRAHAGVAPVTKQSGKSRVILMRRSCNGRLRTAVFHWASNSIRLDRRARAHYDRLRQRHGHARALRGVADRLLRILIVMLTNSTIYDPERPRLAAV